MTGSRESDGRPSQKDHVEHIRTVHFTLVVISFALLVGSSLSRATTTRRALTQLESIDRVVAKWDSEWLNERLKEWNADIVPDSILFVRKSPQRRQGVVIRVGHAWSPADKSDYAKFDESGDPHDFDFERPARLIDFQRLWNRLDSLRIVYLTASPKEGVLLYNSEEEPDREGVFSDRYERFEVVQILDDTAVGDFGTSPLELYAEMVAGDYREWVNEISLGKIKPETVRLQDTASRWVLRSGSNVLVVIAPVPIVEPATLRLQREFADSFRLDWIPGSFSRTFPELAIVSANLSDLTLGKIDTILRGELERSDESVEVFGARIPAEELARWGGPVLFVVQLYLFLHLAALASRLGPADPAWETPWIGLYKGWLPRSLTVLSCVVFPVIVFGVLVFQQRRHPWTVTFWLAFGILLFGLWLAWALAHQLLALWNALPAAKIDTEVSTPPASL